MSTWKESERRCHKKRMSNRVAVKHFQERTADSPMEALIKKKKPSGGKMLCHLKCIYTSIDYYVTDRSVSILVCFHFATLTWIYVCGF